MAHYRPLDDADSYSIAWIAALPIERAAAEAMLDEEYATPTRFTRHQTDPNVYTWGRVGEHNIVIASLPPGVSGTTSAATTASSLLASLPSIRIGLLVGIGGANAQPDIGQDIRLGDIVVSQPSSTMGGVCQYDLVKAISRDKYEQKGFLRPPPTVLLNALGSIQSNHIRKDSKVPVYLQEMLKSNPKMAKNTQRNPGYVHQGFNNDRLFKASCEHFPGPDCQGCVMADEVQRNPRDTTEPDIHYGTIASGNTLVKDAAKRDQIAAQIGGNCICFEMEAAGLMNHFPCIVIRGISDYADSHKNDRWQKYASATAAAYAKELLIYVPSQLLREEKRAIDIEEISNALLQTHSAVVDTRAAVHDLRLNTHTREVLKWLSSVDAATNLNEALKWRQKGSCLWFTESELFKEWVSGSRRHLWVYGIPGCGKTVLSSTIIQHIGSIWPCQRSHYLLYFFFDFSSNEKRKNDQLVRCLVAQLYSNCPSSQHELDQLYSICGDGTRQPSIESLRTTFLCMLRDAGEVRIVIDALDECNTRNDLLQWLNDFSRFEHDGLRLLLTSRQEDDIQTELEAWIHPSNMISLPRVSINCDIRAYIKERLQTDREFRRWRSMTSVHEDIERKIMSKVDGMFRLAACQLDSLRKCLDLGMLRRSLSTLPSTLKDMYARILADIDEIYRQAAIRLLQFLVYSDRPLSIQEAVDVIAVDLSQEPPFEHHLRMPEPRDILRICPSLVVFTDRTSNQAEAGSKMKNKTCSQATITEVHLAHFTVQQYFASGLNTSTLSKQRTDASWEFQVALTESTAQAAIAMVCLAYLSCLNRRTSEKSINETNETWAIKHEFPLAHYAADCGIRSAQLLEENDEVLRAILRLLVWGSPHYPALCEVLDCFGTERSPVYFASRFGLQRTLKALIHGGADLSCKALVEIACRWNQYGTFKTLLENKAAIGPTQLWITCSRGNAELVQLLLESNADPNGLNDHRPLVSACGRGYAPIVRLLLQKGADPNQSDNRETPLVAACKNRHQDVVKLLLDHGSDPNSLCHHPMGTALAVAAHNRSLNIVDLLLKNGADVNISGGEYATALQTAASISCNTDVVQHLLEWRADVTIEGGQHGSALTAAVLTCNSDTVAILLDHGASPNSSGGDRWRSALHAARFLRSYEGSICSGMEFRAETIERLLLAKGAEDRSSMGAETVDYDEDTVSPCYSDTYRRSHHYRSGSESVDYDEDTFPSYSSGLLHYYLAMLPRGPTNPPPSYEPLIPFTLSEYKQYDRLMSDRHSVSSRSTDSVFEMDRRYGSSDDSFS